MKIEFIQVKSKRQALKVCPWASVTVKVVGGYRCFESWTDYEIWSKQK